MIGIGSVVNAGAIVAGGCLGLAVGSLIPRRVQATLVSGMAVGTMFIGAGGTFSASVPVAPGVVAGAPPPPAAAMSQSDHE